MRGAVSEYDYCVSTDDGGERKSPGIEVTLREACGLSAMEAENDRLELLYLKMLERGQMIVDGVRRDIRRHDGDSDTLIAHTEGRECNRDGDRCRARQPGYCKCRALCVA